jgi:voltage-gated potassium channel
MHFSLPFRARRRKPRRIPGRSTSLPRILWRLYFAALALLVVIVLGTFGFRFGAEPTPTWSDSVYMALITISTVGYAEVIPLDSTAERLFAGALSIGGLGVITFLFTSVSVFFLESDLDFTLRKRRMEKQIAKLNGHYIVCGFGRVGRNVAHELSVTRRRFVAIDNDAQQMRAQLEHFPELLHLVGDASDDDLLLAADIENAAGVFAVTGDDSRNLMIALTAKQLNPRVRVVARCHDVKNIPKLRKAGADATVSPDFTGGMRIASAMVRPHVVTFLDEMLRSEHHLRVEEVKVPENCHGRTLGELRRGDASFVLVAVRGQDDWSFNPPDDFVLAPGQTVIAMTSPQGREKLEAALSR